MIFRFRNFKVYSEAKILHREVIEITSKFPNKFYYLRDQLDRSSLSIVLNVAEGSAKRSDRDFNRYLENSMGSVNETVSGLEIAFDSGLINQQKFVELDSRYGEVVKQLGGFSKSLLAHKKL